MYRGTSSGAETFLATRRHVDDASSTRAAPNGTTYYYKVSAENANGEGALSGEALGDARPASSRPIEPLPTVDDFNRPNENPLSDAGRWTNGDQRLGSRPVSTSPRTLLACSKSTTCTAWRNAAQYGPDAEVWARIATLPGTSNHVRLYVRLQQPGSSAYDGYMLRTNQLAGTDQVLLERIDNGAIVNRLTINQELAAGDTLLLRAKGSTHRGLAQRRLAPGRGSASSTDSTYAGAGYAGIGLRGTTGRLDDFGARSLEPEPAAAPPPRSRPSPATRSATPLLDGAELRRRLADHGLQGLSRHEPGTRRAPRERSARSTSFVDTRRLTNGTTYYYKVSARERERRGPALERGSGDADRASSRPTSRCRPSTTSTVPTRTRSRTRPLDERRSTARVETGLNITSNTLACSKSTTCTAWRNAAQYGPDVEVWARHRDATRHEQPCSPVRAHPTAGHLGLRRLHAANEPARRNRPGLPRADRQRRDRQPPDRQPGARGRRHPPPAREGLDARDLAQRRLAPGRGSASSTTRPTPAAGYVGVGLRGTTGRLDDFGARTIGGAPATAPSAPQSLPATAGNAQVSLSWSAPSSNGGSAHHRLPRVSRTPPPILDARSRPDLGVVTNFLDTDRSERQVYYYRVTALQRDRRERRLERGLGDAERARHRPLRSAEPAGDRGQRPGLPLWSTPSSNGGSAHHRLPLYRGHLPRSSEARSRPDLGVVTSYVDTDRRERAGLLLRVNALQRDRREPASNEASATPARPPPPRAAPQSLQATAGNAQVSLSGLTPSSNGGSAHHRLPLYRGHLPRSSTRALARPRRGRRTSLDTDRSERADLLLLVNACNAIGESPPRTRPRRLRRARHRPERSAEPAGDRGQRPGLPRLVCAFLERRLGTSPATAVSRHLARPRRALTPDLGVVHELPRHRPHATGRSTTKGHRAQRDRREPGLERGLGDAERARATRRAPLDHRQLQRAQREPTFRLGSWSNGIVGACRDGPRVDVERSIARRRRRARPGGTTQSGRTSRSMPRCRRFPGTTTSSVFSVACKAGIRGGRRLHAAHCTQDRD